MPTARSSTSRTKTVGTDIPGVFRSVATGHFVDEKGKRMTFAQVQAADRARFIEVMDDYPRTPAELLRAVALDPRQRLDVRLGAAKQAAPYFDQRMPLKIEGQIQTPVIDAAKLASMPVKDRKVLLELLKKAGVEL